VPEGQLASSKARLIRAAGLRWPVEESFELASGCFGLDQCQARLYTAVLADCEGGHDQDQVPRQQQPPLFRLFSQANDLGRLPLFHGNPCA
jgi:hypothetical protein